ncbi:MAG: TM2 domain-containing protein, partial [Pirellulaceae bacterium]
AERGGWPDPLARFDGDGGESRGGRSEASMTEFVGKPYWVAFAWWLLLGWAGAHRFYTGRTVSGLLYAASFGGCGAGWAADLLLLPTLAGRSLRPTCEVESMPAWAERAGRLGVLDFVLRLAFCLVAPLVFVVACVMYNHFELLAVLALVVIPCGLLGNAGRSLERLEVVASWPVIGSALGFVRKLHAFYFEHAPRSFLYYLAYPVTCPLAAIRSPVARREFGLYRNFVAALVSVVAIKYAVEYSATFPPFLGVADAFGFAFMHAVLAIFGTLVLLLPITTTAFTYHFTGRRWRLRTLAALVLLVTIPAGAATYWMDRHSGGATAMARMTLEFRMENEAFRRELRAASEMFLRHHVDEVNQSLLAVPSPVVYLGEPVPTEAVAEHPELTEKYRRLVSGLATRDEADAFRVFVLRESAAAATGEAPATAAYWIGIHATIDPPFVLAAVRPDGHYADDAIVTHWDELPSSVREHFEVDPEADAIESAPHRVAQRLMIDDWR